MNATTPTKKQKQIIDYVLRETKILSAYDIIILANRKNKKLIKILTKNCFAIILKLARFIVYTERNRTRYVQWSVSRKIQRGRFFIVIRNNK